MLERDILLHAGICLFLSILWLIPLTFLPISLDMFINPTLILEKIWTLIGFGFLSGILLALFISWYLKNPNSIALTFSAIGLFLGWFITQSLYYLPFALLFILGLALSRKPKPRGFFNGWSNVSRVLNFIALGCFISIIFWGYTNYDIAKTQFENSIYTIAQASIQNLNVSLNLSITKSEYEEMVKDVLMERAKEYAQSVPGYENLNESQKQELIQQYYSQLLNASYQQYLTTAQSISKQLSQKLYTSLPKETAIKFMENLPPLKLILTYLPIFIGLIIAPLVRLGLYVFTQPFAAILWVFWGKEVIE